MRKFYKIDPRLQIEKIDDVIKEPKIIRVNEFDEECLEDFEKDLDEAHQTGQSIIPIVIDSFGGSVYGVNGMIAAIEQSRLPIATIITSKAMSAGAMLFMFGTEGHRYMHPHADMMIHDISSFSMGKVEDIKVETTNIAQMNKTMFARASKHIGQSPDFFIQFNKKK